MSVAKIGYDVGVLVCLNHCHPGSAAHGSDKGSGEAPYFILVVEAYAEGADAIFGRELAQTEHRAEGHLDEAPVAVVARMAYTKRCQQVGEKVCCRFSFIAFYLMVAFIDVREGGCY